MTLFSCKKLVDNAWFDLCFGIIQLTLSLVIIGYLRFQRMLALRGDEVAARVLVLPIYIYVLYGFVVAELLEGAVNVVAFFPDTTDFQTDNVPTLSHTCISLAFGIYHFVFEGLAILLMQQGAGRASIRRAFFLSACWGVLITAVIFVFETDPDKFWFVKMIISALLVGFYSIPWIISEDTLRYRPALKPYAFFWVAQVQNSSCRMLRLIA